MPPGLGYDFSPVGDKDRSGMGRKPGGASATPVQDAIRVLSLRIPKIAGARSVAPQALLDAMGSGGLPGGAMGIEQLLRRLFGQQGPRSPGVVTGAPGQPPVVPGLQPSLGRTAQPSVGRSVGLMAPPPVLASRAPAPRITVGLGAGRGPVEAMKTPKPAGWRPPEFTAPKQKPSGWTPGF